MGFKQAIVVRGDLKMPKGKLAGQVAHASLDAALRAEGRVMDEWRSEGAKKVVLKVNGIRKLKACLKKARSMGLPAVLITDAAKTFFKRPTVTCIGIGPAEDWLVDRVTQELPLL